MKTVELFSIFQRAAKLEQKKIKLLSKLSKVDAKLADLKNSGDFDIKKLIGDEKYRIQSALYLNGGSRKNAATFLGMNERTFYRRMKEYAL